jgi:hypothetical protein
VEIVPLCPSVVVFNVGVREATGASAVRVSLRPAHSPAGGLIKRLYEVISNPKARRITIIHTYR